MKNLWTDVVLAYEDVRQVLEEARIAYDEACRETISDVILQALPLLQASAQRHGLVVKPAHWERGETPGGMIGRFEISVDGKLWATLATWIASAYDGDPHTIRVEICAEIGKDLFLETKNETLTAARARLGSTGELPADFDEDAVAFASFDVLGDAPVQNAIDAMSQLFEKFAPLVLEWQHRAVPAIKVIQALRIAKKHLRNNPIHDEQELYPAGKKDDYKRDKGENMLYLTLYKPVPSIWIGLLLDDGSLIYAHAEYEDDSKLGLAFAERIGAKRCEHRYAGGVYDAGMLMAPEAVRAASESDLADCISSTFRSWIDFVGEREQQTSKN